MYGQFVAIEVKASNGKPSELQKYNVRKINEEAGGIAVILYPQDWELFKKLVSYLSNAEYDYEARAIRDKINERSL